MQEKGTVDSLAHSYGTCDALRAAELGDSLPPPLAVFLAEEV